MTYAAAAPVLVSLSGTASAIYLGEGATLAAGSLGTLGWTGSLCALAALVLLLLTAGSKSSELAPEG